MEAGGQLGGKFEGAAKAEEPTKNKARTKTERGQAIEILEGDLGLNRFSLLLLFFNLASPSFLRFLLGGMGVEREVQTGLTLNEV